MCSGTSSLGSATSPNGKSGKSRTSGTPRSLGSRHPRGEGRAVVADGAAGERAREGASERAIASASVIGLLLVRTNPVPVLFAMTALVWFRRDLRVHDHPPLRAALAAHERVVPVF